MPTRISNQFVSESFIRSINNSFSKLNKLQAQLTTLKKFELPSENPISANQAILLERNLSEVKQFKENVSRGSEFLNFSDQTVSSIREFVATALAKASQGLNASTEAAALPAIAAELSSLLDSVISTGNASYAGQFIFSGHESQIKPFTKVGNDVLFGGDNGVYNVNVFGNESIQANYGPDGVFGALQTKLTSETDLNTRLASMSLSTKLPAGTLKLQEGDGLEAAILSVTVAEGDNLATIVGKINSAAASAATNVNTTAATAAINAYTGLGANLTVGAQTLSATELATAYTSLSGVEEIEKATYDYFNKKYTDAGSIPTEAQKNAFAAGARAGRKAYSLGQFSASLSRGGLEVLHASGHKISIVEGDADSVDLYADLELPGRRSGVSYLYQASVGTVASDQTLTLTGPGSTTLTVQIRKGDTADIIAQRINRTVNGTSVNSAFHNLRASVSVDPSTGAALTSKLKIVSSKSFSASGVTELTATSIHAAKQRSLSAFNNRVENLRLGVGLGTGAVKLEATNITGFSSDISIRAGDSLDYLIQQLDDLAGFEASLDTNGEGISLRSVARYSTTVTVDPTKTLVVQQAAGSGSASIGFAAGDSASQIAAKINAASSTSFRFHAEVDSTGAKVVVTSNEKFSLADGALINVGSGSLIDHSTSDLLQTNLLDTLGFSTTFDSTGLVSGRPLLHRQTRISELNGGAGATMGKIQFTVGSGTAVVVDLTKAVNLHDVKRLIELALPNQVTVGLNTAQNGLAIKSVDGVNAVKIEENSGGVTARQLGLIPAPKNTVSGVNIQGSDINPVATNMTLLRDLNGASGVDLTGFKITNGANSTTITFDSDGDGIDDVRTLQDLVNHINHKSKQDNVFVDASVDAKTGKLVIASRLANTSLQISEITKEHNFLEITGKATADTTMTITNALGTEKVTVSLTNPSASAANLQAAVNAINAAALGANFDFKARIKQTYVGDNPPGGTPTSVIAIESNESISVGDSVNTVYNRANITPLERSDFGVSASDFGLLGAFSDSTLLSSLNNGSGATQGQFFITYGAKDDVFFKVKNIKLPTAGLSETLKLYNENGSVTTTVTLPVGGTLSTIATTINTQAAAAGFKGIRAVENNVLNTIEITSTNEKITATNGNENAANLKYNTLVENLNVVKAATAKKITIDLEQALTLGDVKRSIEKASNNALKVTFGKAGRLELSFANNDTAQRLLIEETSAAADTAQSLGLIGSTELRGSDLRDGVSSPLTNATLLSDLGLTFNAGPATQSTENHLVLVSGADVASLDLKNAKTVGDVLSAINLVSVSDQATAVDFDAEIVDGRFIRIKNSAASTLKVLNSGFSKTAEKLGLVPDTERAANTAFSGVQLKPKNQADNFFASMIDIIREFSVERADSDLVSRSMRTLESMESQFLTSRAQAGGRVDRFEALKTRFEEDEVYITGSLGQRTEIDLIETTQRFLNQQQAYEAGLSSVSRVLGLSLFDFI